MLRIIAGVIVGWIVMAILVMATFAITWAVLGNDGTFQAGSYWTTDTFNIIVLIGGLIAAIVGGLVCKLIARTSTATLALAAVMLVMGIGSAAMQMNKPDPPARTGAITLEDLAAHGKEPTWFAISKTVAAVVGLLIGSSLVGRKPAR